MDRRCKCRGDLAELAAGGQQRYGRRDPQARKNANELS
jgi:hypothetical protein